MMSGTPSELMVLGIYIPPAFLVCLLGLACTIAVTTAFNWLGFSRWFWHPPLAWLAVWVLASALIGLLFLAP